MNIIFISIIAGISILGMILSNIFIPQLRIKKFTISTFWMAPLLGAIVLLSTGLLDFQSFVSGLVQDRAINPIEILGLFFAMTFMSIVLDEVGFFEKLASWAARKAKGSQFLLFLILYVLTSFLTVFTSNDIIIITFTPFIIFFTRRAHIDPIPYLVSEFVAANTWSLILIIGNPTNIYLASSFGITFIDYLSHMFLSAILAGLVSLGIMILLFKKKLTKQIETTIDDVKIKDKFVFVTALSALSLCIVLMAVSSYVNFPMWAVSLIMAGLLILIIFGYGLSRPESLKTMLRSFKRLPFDLIPFVIAMFAIVLSFDLSGIVVNISSFLNNDVPLLTYGMASFLSANLINNIPMSVLFSNIITHASSGIQLPAIYASIAGSNIGAFLTPFGALAGVMWMSILKKHEIKFSFLNFIKYGFIIAIPTMLAAILGIYLVMI
ncbi:MAG: ArsB/NhaD family transporter [Erysipelotrichaceae bacterium]|nr:ArsB/NhaD family transporter [Erysipelotrichaceae bacterium]